MPLGVTKAFVRPAMTRTADVPQPTSTPLRAVARSAGPPRRPARRDDRHPHPQTRRAADQDAQALEDAVGQDVDEEPLGLVRV